MFREWPFLLGEIWFLLLLAALIGLLAGWLIWGRCPTRADTRAESRPASPLPAAEPAPVSAAVSAAVSAQRPEALAQARGGQPDDLKLVSGIGPRLEALCHRLGFYHFDQLANWTEAEIAWVDENLEGFKGRVTRDNWVGQAKLLARGIDPSA